MRRKEQLAKKREDDEVASVSADPVRGDGLNTTAKMRSTMGVEAFSEATSGLPFLGEGGVHTRKRSERRARTRRKRQSVTPGYLGLFQVDRKERRLPQINSGAGNEDGPAGSRQPTNSRG